MNNRKILIADDEQYVRLLVKSALDTSYSVLEASDGEEALEQIESTLPDLVLMDAQLPDMDGMTVVRILRENAITRDITILALTACAMKGDRERMLHMGCDGHISKPIDVQDFIDTVRKLLSSKTETKK